LGLSEVLFVPAGNPWLKVDRAVTPAAMRVEMVRLAIGSNERFRLCTLEVEGSGPSYTVDTIASLKKELGEHSFFFILGQDSFNDLPLWRNPARLVQLCRLVVVPRLGLSLPESNSGSFAIPGLADRVIELPTPVIGVSSSEVRQRVARGLPVRYLVADGVADYIAEQGLYRY